MSPFHGALFGFVVLYNDPCYIFWVQKDACLGSVVSYMFCWAGVCCHNPLDDSGVDDS